MYELHFDTERNQFQHSFIELIVRGCVSGRWGPRCTGVCNNCYNGGVCDDKTGGCICPPGFSGDNCMNTCGGNRFGLNCEARCTFKSDNKAQCQGTQICLSDPYGCDCITGYTGLKCLTDCTTGKFGAGCSQECHCNSGGCNQYTGVCTSAGCAAGWSGTNCQVPDVCPVGYFGGDCTSICHCKDNVACDKADGTCSNGECAEGYLTYSNAYCEECASRTYGNMCELTCNCDSNSCHHETGCDGGCNADWLPNSCTTGIVSTSNVKVNPGQTTTFQCTVFGDITDVNIALQADSESVAETGRVESTTNTTVSFSTVANTGTVYTFSISKDPFITSRTHTVDLFSLPKYTGTPSVTSVTSSSVELKWPEWDPEQVDSGDGPIVGYVVSYYDTTWIEIPQVSQTSATVTGLDYEQDYSFAVAAVREGGGGKGPLGSQSAYAVTLCGEPSSPLVDTNINTEKPKKIKLSWTPLMNDEAKCSTGVEVYMISYRTSDESLSSVSSETAETTYTLEDLETYTEYTISVTAKNIDSLGEPRIIIEYSPEEKPPAPEVEATHESSYLKVSIKLSSSVSRNLYGKIVKYNVRYKSGDEWLNRTFEHEDNIEDYKIVVVETGDYEVSARVVNGAGPGNWSASIQAESSQSTDDDGGSSTEVIIAVVSILILLSIIALLAVFIVRRRKNSLHKDDSYIQPNHNSFSEAKKFQSDEYLNQPDQKLKEEITTPELERKAGRISIIPQLPDNYDEEMYQNVDTIRPIHIKDLPDFVGKKRLNPLDGLQHEYGKLPKGQIHPWGVASRSANRTKNRFKNIVAYDHSRVVLEEYEDDPESGYINACHVHGYKRDNFYIASQGPNNASLIDFWRMIWQENVTTIVMLSNVIESGKEKCKKYWPDNRGHVAEFGEISILLEVTESYADYKIRSLKVWKDSDVDFRRIKQFHFISWPDMGVPLYATAALNYVKKIKQSSQSNSSPTLVHCSAGVGRTGTFICIDSMMEMIDKEQKVDVYNYVRKLRDQRINMVQTPEQYVFIYDALLEYSLCGDTALNTGNFQTRLSTLKRLIPQTDKTYIEEEFEILKLVTPYPPADHCKAGHLPENQHKNRVSNIVPIDRNRPFLVTESSTGGNEYINASFVDGYKQKDKFIATQMPLPDTVEDMWRLIFDWNVRSVVMLNDMDSNDPSYAKYWMDEEGNSEKYGPLVVTLKTSNSKKDITIREFSITNKNKPEAVSKVKLFQIHGWSADQDIPENPTTLLEVLELVDDNQHDYHHGNHPIAVHCSNGVGRTGIFLTVVEVVERMKLENIIDVFQTVKKLRTNRPGLVQNIDQYIFCYDIISSYLGRFDTYANPNF
ncbi:uncharacterized protein [Antedon mediterranea]|uniref:uncharacterized protein n=1 Tax=Antedon mediterranea TaxID=105859 RepID=UPI003AF463D7